MNALKACVVVAGAAVVGGASLLALPSAAGAASVGAQEVHCRMLLFSTDGTASNDRLEGSDCTGVAARRTGGSVSGPTQTYDVRTKKFSFAQRTFTFTKALRGEAYGNVRTSSGDELRSTVFLAPKPVDAQRR